MMSPILTARLNFGSRGAVGRIRGGSIVVDVMQPLQEICDVPIAR